MVRSMNMMVIDGCSAQIHERYLGTRCPIRGQWLPNACSADAHGLFTGSPTFVQGLNSRWAEFLDTFFCVELNR